MRWILAWLLVSAPAHAGELVVDCKDMDFLALRAALDAELADHPGTALAVLVTCPERDVAVIHVEGRLERRVDLRDVPPALRPRLVALTAAESLALAEPAAAEPMAVPPPPPEAPTLPAAVRRARPAGAQVGVEPQVGVRAFRPGFAVAPVFAADLRRGRWSAGASFSTVAASDPDGEVRLGVAAVGLGARVVCDDGAVWCLEARGDAGLAWADAAPVRGVSSREPRAPYLALAARGSLDLRGARLSVDLGWAEGLVARSEHGEVARAAGAFVGLAVGVRVW